MLIGLRAYRTEAGNASLSWILFLSLRRPSTMQRLNAIAIRDFVAVSDFIGTEPDKLEINAERLLGIERIYRYAF